jgi:outer membrane protein
VIRTFIALLALTARAQERSLTLQEAYDLARARSEKVAIQGQAAIELESRVSELVAAVKPRLGFKATETLQDVPSGNASSLFGQSHREEFKLTLHQPLFSGFREFLAVKAARLQGSASQLALKRAEDALFQDVGRAFLDVLGARWQLDTRRRLIAVMQDRVKELESRERLGRSRHSELVAARAQLALLEADLDQALGAERVQQNVLGFLTGLDAALAPVEPSLASTAPLAGLLLRSESRPDVEQRRREFQASELTVSVYSRQRWPTLAADGNYYLKRPPGFTDRIKWDAVFTLDLPIYEGGAISAQVRQARARRTAAERQLSLALRQAKHETRSAHEELGTALSAAEALSRARKLSEENARLQTEDYRLGMVTNLEVLGALNTLQEIQLKADQARIAALWAQTRLAVASGGRP